MTTVQERMAGSPAFASKEKSVRSLENEANVLSRGVDELTSNAANFERQFAKTDISSPQGLNLAEVLRRARVDLHYAETQLVDLRKRIELAIAARDAQADLEDRFVSAGLEVKGLENKIRDPRSSSTEIEAAKPELAVARKRLDDLRSELEAAKK
jgi:phage-related minor tail protein